MEGPRSVEHHHQQLLLGAVPHTLGQLHSTHLERSSQTELQKGSAVAAVVAKGMAERGGEGRGEGRGEGEIEGKMTRGGDGLMMMSVSERNRVE